MSQETDLIITVPRPCVNDFFDKYFSLVETFYHVTLRENKTIPEKPDVCCFDVVFNTNPVDGSFNTKEVVNRIQKYVESSLGWAGERADDSSYDSECDDEGSHRAASRTPSDTLAAEFAEYVTLSPQPQPNQAKIEFAVKLGYSERLAQIALQRLGPDPPRNELLAELIKLASKQPPRALSPPLPLEPEPHVEKSPLRPIVIDGSNVAMSHGNKEVFSCRGIEICVDWFKARGHTEITVFVPKWRKEASRPDNPVADRDSLERLEKEKVLVYTPSRLVGGKRLVCYDDRYVLRLAADTDGIVVSNDNYRDLVVENPEFRKVVEERLLMYSFVNDRFMPPDDPLGRTGPTLNTFLRTTQSKTEPPPACPYGRKCTYGNKCKFHHPERAGRPHKSVAEKLSERAARTLRPHHNLYTLSLPPEGPSRLEESKQQLARAHSAAPRLAADPHGAILATHFESAQLQLPGPSQPPANPHRKLARQLTLNPSEPRGCVLAAGPGAAHWEARRRMHYHLAGIFPEPQVAEAMAAHPDETDAKTMCALILARYRPNEATIPPH